MDTAAVTNYQESSKKALRSLPFSGSREEALLQQEVQSMANINFKSAEVRELLKPYENLPLEEIKGASTEIRSELGVFPARELYMLSQQLKRNDPKRSRQYLHQSAAKGEADALFELSEAYRFSGNFYDIDPNLYLARLLCEEAAQLDHPDAIFHLRVSSFTERLYGAEKEEYIQGLNNALELEREGNAPATKFLRAVRRMGIEAILEVHDNLNEEDVEYLRTLGVSD